MSYGKHDPMARVLRQTIRRLRLREAQTTGAPSIRARRPLRHVTAGWPSGPSEKALERRANRVAALAEEAGL